MGIRTRPLLRTLLAAGSLVSGTLAVSERRDRGRLAILNYHRILPPDLKAAYFNPDLAVTPEAFLRHCGTLRRHFDVFPLCEALEAAFGEGRRERPAAAITFDDGYGDNHRYAAPILRQCGLRATFFVVADLAGTEDPPWYDRLGRAFGAWCSRGGSRHLVDGDPLKAIHEGARGAGGASGLAHGAIRLAKGLSPQERKELVDRLEAGSGGKPEWDPVDRIMDWGQLAEIAEAGNEIGSHSAAHEILPRLEDSALDQEVAGSKETIEGRLGRPVRSFAYPNGDVDDRVALAVERSGYRQAVTTESGRNDPTGDRYRLRRTFISQERLKGLGEAASGLLLRMELCGLSDRVLGWRRRPS